MGIPLRNKVLIFLANLATLIFLIIGPKINILTLKACVTFLPSLVLDKKKILLEILEKNKLHAEQIAYIGDDVGDLEVIKSVGLAGAVADAHPGIKKHSHFICSNLGGKGAVREFIEFILEAQNKWPTIEASLKEFIKLKEKI